MSAGLFHTYIVASRSRVLYTGVTGDLRRRMLEHRSGQPEGFAARYRCTRLVWCAAHADAAAAIAHEKQIKGWTRARKIALIERENQGWQDLNERWFVFSSSPRIGHEAGPSLRSG
jgi:putative endonuclease